MAQYGNDSISSLKGAERVRKRPEVIFGSNGLEGCQHAVFEILSNSIDEAREGYGKVIEVTRFMDHSIEVKDMGRGVPVEYNSKEERYNWELVFCEMYAGGKYKNNSGENYEYSLGLNGLGSCATQYASEYMEVTVQRDGYRYKLYFEKGENVGGLYKEEYRYRHTGTIIKWKPDLEVFTDIDIPLEYFQTTMKKQAVVNAGITFRLKNETANGMETFTYCYENGITDYLQEVSGENALTSIQYHEAERRGKDREDKPEYKLKMQVAFCFTNTNAMLEYYHNSSFLEYGGSPDKAVKSAFVSAIDAYVRGANKYTKGESKITFTDVQDSLALVINSFSTMTSYENQTKKAINNRFIAEAMTDFLRQNLEIYFIENKVEAEKIAEQVLLNKRSRETAERTRVNLKKKLAKNIDVTNRVQKFVDCRTRDIGIRELYIVEGDSALGSVKLARDANFQAVMPVRGKILNCLKCDWPRIFKSDIIMDLMRVLGCGIEVKSKDFNAFDMDNLRWDKIIICTDADVDGYQIRTLILAMLYRLTPTLIEAGKVYIAESPLFEINTKKDTYFAFSEREKAQILAKLEGQKYTIQRSKGLGENNPDMMNKTTMNPATRRLIRVMPEEAAHTAAVFELLLGDDLQGRKDYIEENGAAYIDMADVM
ncbi:MAG: toprim domain-containing protein [Clostridia bacterium]|nr:toprim domain-containing protein [Clostridia bacterium]